MPINVQNCRAQPTTVSLGNFNGGAFRPTVMGLHRHYTAANCLVALNPMMNHGVGIAGVTSLDPQVNPGGDTYFLPFSTDEITSIVLPAPGGAGVQQSFLTTNLSGCMVYVDRVQGVPGSVVVYHANSQANAPGGRLGGQQPTLQLPACTNELTRLYNLAQANLTAAPYNLNLIQAGSVDKPAYNAGARAEVNRKIGQARTNVEFTGGTIVFGRVNGANWEFFWATYGGCEYDRPVYAPKGWFGHVHRNPTTSTNPNYRMLGSAQFV